MQAHLVDSNSVEISVIDHGPGVPEDLRQVVFEKFRQGDSGLARGHGGTGLGLANEECIYAVRGVESKIHFFQQRTCKE